MTQRVLRRDRRRRQIERLYVASRAVLTEYMPRSVDSNAAWELAFMKARNCSSRAAMDDQMRNWIYDFKANS
jgi:hypothetical protein